MSQYVNFFLRCEDKFIPLFSFSRNSYLYGAFHTDAPYGKISAITSESLKNAQKILLDTIETYQGRMASYVEEQRLIPSFNNSVEEKLIGLRDMDELISNVRDEMEELNAALGYCSVMDDILETAKYGEKVPVSTYNENSLLYCGIEIATPTLDDIEEDK